MSKGQKIAVGVLLGTQILQTWASQRILKHNQEVEAKNQKLREFGLHMISMLERENVDFTEFDLLVFEYFRSEGDDTPKHDDGS